MPATLTLKNIPDELHERLKASAGAHRRSLDGEAIVRLETVLMGRRVDAFEREGRS
jgi:plasmid stability protein